jgi:hypothetical protein
MRAQVRRAQQSGVLMSGHAPRAYPAASRDRLARSRVKNPDAFDTFGVHDTRVAIVSMYNSGDHC